MNEKTIVVISQDTVLSGIVERTLNDLYRVLLFRNIHIRHRLHLQFHTESGHYRCQRRGPPYRQRVE